MTSPLRSQSFRHRSRPINSLIATNYTNSELKRLPFQEITSFQERRRSTPTISRRYSLQKNKVVSRTDVWPKPKQISQIEERFLKLPDFEDYTRVRQFKIDERGAVVNRGDSFRRKKTINQTYSNYTNLGKNESTFPTFSLSKSESLKNSEGNTTTTTTIDSRSTSVSSNDSSGVTHNYGKSKCNDKKILLKDSKFKQANNSNLTINEIPSTSHLNYKVCVIGQTGSGKSSLISQIITSEYRNAFADEIEDSHNGNVVSVNIGGYDCDLTFVEVDYNLDDHWEDDQADAYVLVYSIDRKSSFKIITNILEDIRKKKKSVPIIVAGNKVDLERRRAVSAQEIKCVMLKYDVVPFEISVALNHDIDDLLVGIVAEIKESIGFIRSKPTFKISNASTKDLHDIDEELLTKESEEFKAAIRRFSQRKKRQMCIGGKLESEVGKCTHLSPVSLFERFRQWRRGISKC